KHPGDRHAKTSRKCEREATNRGQREVKQYLVTAEALGKGAVSVAKRGSSWLALRDPQALVDAIMRKKPPLELVRKIGLRCAKPFSDVFEPPYLAVLYATRKLIEGTGTLDELVAAHVTAAKLAKSRVGEAGAFYGKGYAAGQDRVASKFAWEIANGLGHPKRP